MKHLESKLQTTCVKWFRLQYPNYLLFAIPNGGARDLITGAIMKREGVVPGVPDLFLAHATFESYGLFIEMKSDKGKLSPNQIYVRSKLELAGYHVEICNSFESFKSVIENYLTNPKP